MSEAMAAVLIGLFGACVGSFLNVCIHRLPRRESLAFPPSHCPSCQRRLAWYENVPILSWTLLRGRCRTCRAHISVRYPLVELVTAVLFVAAWGVYGLSALLAVRLVFVSALIVLFAIDYEHQILPNAITLPGVVVGFVAAWFVPPGWTSSLIGLAAGGLFPFLVAEAYLRLRGREGMGMGDFKMMAMVGAFLGWPAVWITLLLACVLGIVIGGGALWLSRRGMETRVPFGTFIAVAALASVYRGDAMLALYEQAIAAYLRWAGV